MYFLFKKENNAAYLQHFLDFFIQIHLIYTFHKISIYFHKKNTIIDFNIIVFFNLIKYLTLELMLYNQPGPTIAEMFYNAAKETAAGNKPNWHRILILVGIIDSDKSTKINPIYMEPYSKHHYNDIKQIIEWLRPYSNSDILISNTIINMDKILKNWKDTYDKKQS